MRTTSFLAPSLLALAAGLSAAEFAPIPAGSKSAGGPQPLPAPKTQDETPVIGSGPALVVSATRLDSDPAVQPYALHQHDKVSLDQTNARTLTDKLNYTPGIYIQHTASNQSSPYIRGLTGEQTLLLFDGVRLSHAMMRPGANQYSAMIPDEAVGRIDTILGSSSTVTGSDGLTGAIDFRLAEAGRDADAPLRPVAGTRYGSADGASAFAGVDGRSHGFAYSAEFSHAEYHELRGGKDAGDHLFGDAAGSQRIPNSEYRQVGYGTRVAYEGWDDHRTDLALGFVRQSEAPRPDGYFENSGSAGRISRSYDPQDFTYLHLRHAARFDGPIQRAQATVWWHQHIENQFREDIQGTIGSGTERYRRREYEDQVDTIGLDLQLGSLVADTHSLTYGTTIYQDATANAAQRFRSPSGSTDADSAVLDQSGATTPGTTTVPDDSTYTGLGLFIQDDWQINETWNLVGGLRVNRSAWDFTVTDDRPGFEWIAPGSTTTPLEVSEADTGITGSLRAGWQATPTIFGFAGLSQGYRSPSLSNLAGVQDRGSSSSGGSGPQVEGNIALESEKSLTTEVGTRWVDDRDTASINLFVTQLQDLIQVQYIDVNSDGIIDGTNDRAQMVNAESGILYGFEVAHDIAIPIGDWLDATVWRPALVQSTSYVRGEAEVSDPALAGGTSTQNISKANLFFGKAGLRLSHINGWWGMFQARYQAGYDDVTAGDAGDTRHTTFAAKDGPAGAMPGFVVWDALVGYADPRGKYQATAGFENLFDHSYRPVGSGTDGAGFNAVLSLQMVF